MLQLAMERCGSAPATTVMIGDNPSTDIAGARNVGMNAVWISNGRAGDGFCSACSKDVEDDGFTVTNIGKLLKVVARWMEYAEVLLFERG
jgi:FMN phosphatase YigB (HAD superfamily)